MPVTKITRGEIIERAAELFREQGYHRTSMEEIGVVCGLQKGSFYHHFRSKKRMMLEVLKEYTRRFEERAHHIAYDRSLSQEQRIKGILKASEAIFPGMNGCLMANTVLETANTVPEFTIVIREFFESWIDAFAAVFVETISKTEARKLAELSVGEIEGALMLMRVHNDRRYVVNAAKHVLARISN